MGALKLLLNLGVLSSLMSSSSHSMLTNTGAFNEPVGGALEGDHSVMNEFSTEKWPVWLRLLTIIGLSTGLWSAIIWAFVAIFG